MTRLVWIFIALIVAVAALTRLPQLDTLPGDLYIDEMAMLVDARSVADRGTDMHGNPWYQTIFPSYGDLKLPAYIWLTSGMMHIVGNDAWVIRLPSALAGIGSVAIIMLLAARIGELFQFTKQRRIVFALAAGAVVAVAPWSIHFSRIGFEGHLGQFFLLLSILSATYVPKWWGIIGAAVFGAVATYSYFSVLYVWVGVLAMLMIVLGWQHVQRKQSIRPLLLTLVLIGVLYYVFMLPLLTNTLYPSMGEFRLSTPSLLNTEKHILRSNQYRETLGLSLPSKVFHREAFRFQMLAEHMSAHFEPGYLFLSGDPYPRHSTGRHGLFLWPFALALVVGMITLARKQRALLLILGCWWFISVIPAALTNEFPHALRSLNGLGAVSLIIAFGLLELYGAVRQLTGRPLLARALLASTLLIFSFSFLEYWIYYSSIYPNQTKTIYWYSPYQEAAELVRTHVSMDEQLFVDWPSDKWFLWYLGSFPEWYDAEIASHNYHFYQIGNTHLFQQIEQKRLVEPMWILAQPSQYEKLQNGQTWQILESYPLSGADAALIRVK